MTGAALPEIEPAPRQERQPLRPGWRKMLWLKIAIVLFGWLLTIPINSFFAKQSIDDHFSRIDSSWQLEMPVRLSHGDFSGRDFIFTFGPFFQAEHALSLLFPQRDWLASHLRFHALLGQLLSLLIVWWLISITNAPLIWRAACYLWITFWWYPDLLGTIGLKPLGGILLAAACGLALASASAHERVWHSPRFILLWSVAAPIAMLYSFDLGLLTFVALMMLGVAVLIFGGLHPTRSGRVAQSRALSGIGFAVLGAAIFISALQILPGWNRNVIDAFALASGYSLFLAHGITRLAFVVVCLTALAAALVIVFAGWRMRADWQHGEATKGRTIGILATACFCLLWTRYGLTRSDFGHVMSAVAPAFFLVGYQIPCYRRAEGARYALPLLALMMLLTVSPLLIRDLTEWKHSSHPFLSGTRHRIWAVRHLDLSPAYLEIKNETLREATAVARRLPSDVLYVWPYETIINLLAERRNPSYTLQSYAATTDDLEERTVARLQSEQRLPVIVFTETYSIDQVEPVSRTPRIFRYLLNHYELSGPPSKSFFVLERHQQGDRRWAEEELPIEVPRFVPGANRALEIKVPIGPNALAASDLLVLRMRATQTRLWGVRKLGALRVDFTLSNGERRSQRVLLKPDGKAHDIIVTALTVRDPLFPLIFAPSQRWRSSERISNLKVSWHLIDLLSKAPAEISLDRIAVLRRTDTEVIEAELSQSRAP